jgi:hypothetical protein
VSARQVSQQLRSSRLPRSGDWVTSETLDRLSFRATRVTLTERQRFMTVLRLIRR